MERVPGIELFVTGARIACCCRLALRALLVASELIDREIVEVHYVTL